MVKVTIDYQGVQRGILKDAGVKAECRRIAEQAAAQCGDGFEVSEHVGRNRANVSIIAVTEEAKKRQWDQHVVDRAIGFML